MDAMILATIGEAVGGTFGGVAALLLVGGGVLLRSQRERLRFELAKTALDKGVAPPVAAGLPAWLTSLRRAAVILAVGVGLLVAGGRVVRLAKQVPLPPADALAADVPPAPPAPPAAGVRPTPPPPPPRPNPAVERWHFAQDEQAIGLAASAGGGILVLLGLARAAFAVVERRYEPAAAAGDQTRAGG